MFLVDENMDSQLKMNRWYDVMTGDLRLDEDAQAIFQQLLRTNPPEAPVGFQEGNKVLYHCFKDKYVAGTNFCEWRNSNFTGYVKRACEEAIEALEDPANVWALRKPPTRGEREMGKGYHEPWVQGKGYGTAGSSNDPPPDPAGKFGQKGKDKGKGPAGKKGGGGGLFGPAHGKGVRPMT